MSPAVRWLTVPAAVMTASSSPRFRITETPVGIPGRATTPPVSTP
jgi:hypothetical protein